MNRLIMLGVGNGSTENLYNTCFVIQNKKGNFLVDAGGSIGIITRLRQANIDYKALEHIFISHRHTDHILGLIWLFKLIGVAIYRKEIKHRINVYSNSDVNESIILILEHTLPALFVKLLKENINFVILEDGDKHIINDIEYTFFDAKAKGFKLFGFECILNNKRLVFLGDETLKLDLYDRVRNADYVMHEVFCLESDRNKYVDVLVGHSTIKDVSEIINELNVKNLILYHTEETYGKDRKRIYFEEGNKYYKGKLYIPDDLEIIEIN